MPKFGSATFHSMHAVSDPICYACRHARKHTDYDFNIGIVGLPRNIIKERVIDVKHELLLVLGEERISQLDDTVSILRKMLVLIITAKNM